MSSRTRTLLSFCVLLPVLLLVEYGGGLLALTSFVVSGIGGQSGAIEGLIVIGLAAFILPVIGTGIFGVILYRRRLSPSTKTNRFIPYAPAMIMAAAVAILINLLVFGTYGADYAGRQHRRAEAIRMNKVYEASIARGCLNKYYHLMASQSGSLAFLYDAMQQRHPDAAQQINNTLINASNECIYEGKEPSVQQHVITEQRARMEQILFIELGEPTVRSLEASYDKQKEST